MRIVVLSIHIAYYLCICTYADTGERWGLGIHHERGMCNDYTVGFTAVISHTHHPSYHIHVICIQEAVSIVGMFLEEGATAACQELIAAAMMRWEEAEGDYRDDVRYTYAFIYTYTSIYMYEYSRLYIYVYR